MLLLQNIVIVSLSCVLRQRYDKKEMKSCRGDLDAIKPKIAKLRADLELVHKCMNTSRTDPNYHNYCVSPPESFSSTGNQVPSGRRMDEVEAPQDRSSAATTTDIFAIGDMYLSGYSTKCGAQVRQNQ